MKKTSLFFAAIFLAVFVWGQNEKYQEKMGEALGQFAFCTSADDFQKLANQFDVIAKVQTGEWLPLYYQAHCYIMIGFMDQLETGLRDNYLELAHEAIKKMETLAPEEAEVYVMRAFYHTGYLVVDPPQRAMGSTPMIHAAIGRALELDPGNPRAIFLRISNEMGTAAYFGSDTAPYCEEAGRLLESWDAYQVKSPIHPTWGKAETEGIVKSCSQ